MALCVGTVSLAQAASNIDTTGIDAAIGRPGVWIEGVYLVTFPRPDLRVMLDRVRLSTAQVVSFVTFIGTGENSAMMGEICALPGEATPVIERLRAGGLQITAVHDHFLGESPRIVFIHFMAQGRAIALARSFRTALAATATRLGKVSAPAESREPGWAKVVGNALGRPTYYLAQSETLEADVTSAHFPAGPMDYWYESTLYFQQASAGKIAATGDVMVTASELNPVLSILLEHHFQILAVHNHMLYEHPRLLFVHYWKIGTPQDLADGLKATLAAVHTRQK
ncbi:MAG: DUF1259 domain-containing protein [Vulcanimicrobiaceae bacterium]